MKVLVIGGSGRLGSCLVQKFQKSGVDVISTHNNWKIWADSIKYDVFRDDLSCLPKLSAEDIVIFAAAVEKESNYFSLSGIMKRLTDKYQKSRFIYISSDAIFNGVIGLRKEDIAPVPATQYGQNLLTCERFVRSHPDHCIIRPAYLYGYNGRDEMLSRFEDIIRELKLGNPVYRFGDVFKSPICFWQAAEIIMMAALNYNFQEVLHVAGPRLSIFEFFQKGLSALGIDTGNLRAEELNPNHDPFIPVDTSLDYSKMIEKLNVEPLPVEKGVLAK